MHRPPASHAAALLASLLFLASCSDDVPLVAPSPTAPSFNHVHWNPTGTTIAVNNLRIQLDPDALWNGWRGDISVLYGGGLAFATGDTAIVWYDPRTSGSGLAAVADMRVAVPGPIADHQTVSLLAPVATRRYGPNTPPPLVVVQETFAFAAAADADYLIVKYTLVNPGPAAVTGLYAAQVLDQDIGPNISDNFVQWRPDDRSVRQFNADYVTHTGHRILTDIATQFRGWHNGSFPPENPDPTSWTEAFAYLSGGISEPQFLAWHDMRDLIGIGPFTLAAGETRVLAFVLAADGSPEVVTGHLAAAQARWETLPALARGPYPVEPVTVTVVPRTIQLDARGPIQVRLDFASSVASRFDAGTAWCAGAQPTRVLTHGTRTVLFLERSALDPVRLYDGNLRCGGWLTDSAGWTGAAPVTVMARTGPLGEPAVVTRLTTDPGAEMHPTWSPDGQSIAFDGTRGGVAGLWRMSVSGGEATVQLLTAPGGWPDWSPDGTRIVFPDPAGFLAVPAAGGTPTRIGNGGGMPAWSRDGAFLAFARNNTAELWVMDVASGAERIVATEPSNMYPEWGPEGRIYFVASGRADDSLAAIVRVDPAIGPGSVERVTPIEGVPNRAPAVTPDGGMLAFASDVPFAGREIVLQDPRTGEHTVLALDLAVQPLDRLEFSPDGRRIAFSSGGDIYVADLPRWAWRPGR